MATIPSVQLFRNSNIITGRQAAIDALEAQKAKVADGGLILARYSEDGSENGVKTLLGIVRNGGGTNVQLTVIDVEGAAQNVQSAITSAIDSLNKGDAEVEGEYVSSVSEDKGIITVTRKPLPSVEKKVSVGKAVTAVTQTNGKIGVEFGGVAAANVSVADSTGKFDSDNVEDTLLEIKTSLDNAIGTGGTVEKQISDAISAISGTTPINNGEVITAISQTKGRVSVSTATLGADKVSASTIESSDTTVAVTGTKVSEQIASLATSIKTVSAAAKTYSIAAISGDDLTALGNNVREAYKLVDEDGVKAGDIIKIYKDSSLKEVALNGQTLNFTYILADGNESTVGVDVSTFLAESEFKDGLEVVDGIVKVKKDASSEEFLSVSESGVKLDGVRAAINTAAAAATTKVEKTDGGSHVTLTSTTSTTDSSVTYTISESDIASATGLAQEIQDRQNAISGISGTTTITNGQVITAISQTAGIVSVTAATLGAENVSASTIDDDGSKVAVTGGNVAAQISSLATSIKSVESAATTALTAETTARQNQDNTIEAAVGLNEDGTHARTTGNYTSGATTVVGEIAALDTKLKEVSDTLGTGVSTVATVTAQLQALSGSSTSDTSDTISVIGAKKYTDAKVEALNLNSVGGIGKVITTISQSNGQVSASAIDLTASNVKATESTGVSTAVDVTGETVSEQIASLATSIKSASTAAAAAHTEVKPKTDKHVRVSVSKSSDNTHDVVTITEDDIASATALEDETTNRQNADTELSNRLGDDVTTDLTATAQLRALSGSPIDGKDVTSVYGAKAYAKDLVDNLNAEVGSTTGTSKTEAIKIVQAHGKIDSITLGAFDCGTY